jgi:hypothetical protein
MYLRKPSPPMGVALLALFVAIGGSSYAATKVRGKDIKTGAVGTRAVKNRALSSRDLRRDTLGGVTVREERLNARKLNVRRLHTVPRARRVAKNAVGARALGAVTRRFGKAATVANGAVTLVDASCKKGEIVLGGGGRWGSAAAGQSLQSSFAATDGRWAATGANASGASRSFQAFAMCLAS